MLTSLCALHCEMRVTERVLLGVEGRLRQRVASGGAGAVNAVAPFNLCLKDTLHTRHSIKKNPDTDKLYEPSVDGRDAARLRDDWLKMGRPGETFQDMQQRLMQHRRDGSYDSKYFAALHAALADAGDCADELSKLPAMAAAACTYAQSMQTLRLSPQELRAYEGGPRGAYDRFERLARDFSAQWRAMGFEFAAYGYHLWTNMPYLYRKWGCMELVSQQGMEGTVGKLSRLLPRIPWHVRGRYKKGLTRTEQEEVLEQRRADLASPSQKVVEEFLQEAMESVTEHLPNKQHDTRHTLKEILLAIDHDIEAGQVISYEEYVGYWRRYMATHRYYVRLRARAEARVAGRYLIALRKENERFMDAGASVPMVNDETEMKRRVRAACRKQYHETARAVRDKGGLGDAIGGRNLWYQARGPPSRCVRMVDVEGPE